MNITGQTKIFKKEINGRIVYSVGVSHKLEDGKYESIYITAQLTNGQTAENMQDINIKKGFLTCYSNKEGKKFPKIVIQEFETEDNSEQTEAIYEDDLPF